MKTLHQIFVAILVTVFCSCAEQKVFTEKDIQNNKSDQILWYDKPAKNWMMECLPIGNGYMGAMFYGEIDEEHIQFNEESLWAGGKGEWDGYNGGNRENAHLYLPQVRKLLNEGKFKQAHALANKELTGIVKNNDSKSGWIGFGSYQTFGDLYVKVNHKEPISDYRRELNITKAIGNVNYKEGNITHNREYFASYPLRTLVFRFENDAVNGVDYTLRLETPHKSTTVTFQDNQLVLSGALENNGMGLESRMLIKTEGGEIIYDKGEIQVNSAKNLTLYLTASTDYLNEYPNYKGRDYKSLNLQTIGKLEGKNYQDVLTKHVDDYQSLFNNVSLFLGDAKTDLPTNERLKSYSNGTNDPALEALYFQYGRYLMISSSRPGTLPANLQGKWNNSLNPPWASDYHANINIQMIYWPTEVTNLAECHEPLIDYIDKLREPGRKTAKNFFDANGWIVNTMNNTFGFTAPGWDFPWGFFPGGAAWYSRHVWEHYNYSQDKKFLSEKGYPIMKEAALFWLDYLIEDEDGYLVSSPSYSPEHGGISKGAYMDIQIVWDLFSNCIEAEEILHEDANFKARLIAAREKLLPPKIGKWGQLQEWKEDVDNPNDKHRHVSHLFALFPGHQINLEETPKLAEAAKVSLKARGDDGTGWSIAWKINFWARLHDGDHAYKLLRRAMQFSNDSGVNMMDGGGAYPNLLSTHPPFQLDGNMGLTAGIAEMLVQSHTGNIQLLPALPTSWPNGKVVGLKARGGIELAIEWKDGKPVVVEISSSNGGSHKISYENQVITLDMKKNEVYNIGPMLNEIK